MNSALLFRFAEWGALILAMLVAAGVAVLPRRLLARRARESKQTLARWVLAVLESWVFPLLALGLGWLLLWLPGALGLPWADRLPASHRLAWDLFWLALLAFNLVETTLLQITAAGGRFQIPALLRGVLRIGVIALAAFLVLRFALGWNITPLLASTALLTAVIGFALQGVLGNLLAGMSLNLTGALAPRDWVAIDDLEGQVDEMNWRETWLVTRERIPVRIPNSKVADGRIRNLTRPAGPRRCTVSVDASYDDPPDTVLDALNAAAAAVPEVRTAPPPQVLLMEYKSYGIGYELRIWLDDYPFREPVMAEVRRHIWYQFRRRGIQIPYPVTDQVLNDFMERAIVPATTPRGNADAGRRAAGLLQSDFARKVLTGPDGQLLVPADALTAWAGSLPAQRYGRGEILFRQGESGECCYVVLSGELEGRIQHADSGRTTTFALGPGAVVGEMSLMTGLPRMAEVRVKDSAELLRIPAPDFAELLGKHAGLIEQMSQLVSERVRQNRQQLNELLAAGGNAVDQALSREGILRRFWHLLGGA